MMKAKKVSDSNLTVPGFKAAAVAAGIKKKDRLDLGLIAAKAPATAAGVFTTNRVRSPAVALCRERLRRGKARAVLVNSGNANTCVGPQGIRDARILAEYLSLALGVPEGQVLISQTGVIGEPLPRGRIEDAIPRLVRALRPEGFLDFARAIMTTDTRPKISMRECKLGKKRVKILGIAKGSGMIQPSMATMLCYLLTDASVTLPLLRALVKAASEKTFNTITVDGQMSTSDTVIALASGVAEAERLMEKSRKARVFGDALTDLCADLARQIVADGEGATRIFKVEVIKARSARDAEKVARMIANSLLVKTAFHAGDANWGRVLAAAGSAGVDLDPEKIDLVFAAENGRPKVEVARKGALSRSFRESIASKILAGKSFRVILNLNQGKAGFSVTSCDLSAQYVRINAEYRT
jgi:glutamate N-acetyltransferase/amino-acid N-acetyltransferase